MTVVKHCLSFQQRKQNINQSLPRRIGTTSGVVAYRELQARNCKQNYCIFPIKRIIRGQNQEGERIE